ncbi:uncharacterized protein LOC129566554 [Sitodiplosis mosellana]|uniref:uncharacterized protein LOC129566554 n=1 Tax=Sitodiplosis mosellana TaxID=263140 RepID=UPI0024451F88|nr:uncharacterized protein LOC129566554 [Sitodiplosis mosellana]
MDASMRNFLIKLALLIFGVQCGIWGPIYVYFSAGLKTTTIEVKFPFTEEKSNAEYAMNMLLQWIGFGTGGLIFFGIEVAMQIIGNVVTVSSKLIRNRLKELDKKIEENMLSELELRFVFKDITKEILDYENYVNCVREFLAERTLITPALFTYSIGMAIFCQYSMGFVAGYGMSLMAWVQFFYVCEVGEQVESSGLDEILYDINWYNFPKEMQKDLMHLINHRQNAAALTVGPFGNVNRNLVTVVTNKIYSFVMFLHNFTA